jgi:hypothetical protein
MTDSQSSVGRLRWHRVLLVFHDQQLLESVYLNRMLDLG